MLQWQTNQWRPKIELGQCHKRGTKLDVLAALMSKCTRPVTVKTQPLFSCIEDSKAPGETFAARIDIAMAAEEQAWYNDLTHPAN